MKLIEISAVNIITEEYFKRIIVPAFWGKDFVSLLQKRINYREKDKEEQEEYFTGACRYIYHFIVISSFYIQSKSRKIIKFVIFSVFSFGYLGEICTFIVIL